MKDRHNVILILVASSEINSLFRRLIKFLISFVHLSFPGVPSSLNYFTMEIHLNHYKVLPCVLNFSFFSLPFVYRSTHEGSTWLFIKDLYSFSKQSWTFFSEELKFSSSFYPECNSFFRIIGGGIMSFLIIWIHVSWFTCC